MLIIIHYNIKKTKDGGADGAWMGERGSAARVRERGRCSRMSSRRAGRVRAAVPIHFAVRSTLAM